MDMDYEPYMLVEGRKAMENPPPQSLHQKLLAEAFNMNGRLILASEEQTTHPSTYPIVFIIIIIFSSF
jgi:hypothetical protein